MSSRTAVKRIRASRSELEREALLAVIKEKALEARHRAGYVRHPADEFDAWEHEQAWIDR